jgi:hypothetical protein
MVVLPTVIAVRIATDARKSPLLVCHPELVEG